MTPTLAGRLQTRLVLLGSIGIPCLLVVTALAEPGTLAGRGRAGLTALLVTATVGAGWELLYHALQQLRWEKDWPTIFGLAVGVPEGIVAWLLLSAGLPFDVGDVSASTFLTMFISLWLLVWAIANGPLQIFFLRWRYQGGRFLGGW